MAYFQIIKKYLLSPVQRGLTLAEFSPLTTALMRTKWRSRPRPMKNETITRRPLKWSMDCMVVPDFNTHVETPVKTSAVWDRIVFVMAHFEEMVHLTVVDIVSDLEIRP